MAVMSSKICPRCQNRKFYRIRRGKLRCKKCGYEFRPKIAGLRIKKALLKQIIYWFVLEHPIRSIAEQTKTSRYLTLKAVHLLKKGNA